MGGCVGTARQGSGGRGSRRPSGFSESTSSALHTTHTKNKPLRRDKIRFEFLALLTRVGDVTESSKMEFLKYDNSLTNHLDPARVTA